MGQSTLPFGFVFSQSSLQDYNDCPRRFQLRYIEKLHWPAVEMEPALENEHRQQEGQLFHRLVQQHIIGIQKNHDVSLTVSESRIQRRGLAAIVLQNRFDPIAIIVNDRARLIG